MGYDRKELHSEKLSAGSRTYFIDIKESIQGIKYLLISENQENEGENKKRHVIVFEEHLLDFYKSLRKAISYFIEHDDTPYVEEQKQQDEYESLPKKSHAKWTDKEEEQLVNLLNEGKNIREIAESLQRSEGAISSRLEKIGFL